jgi:hypothetical protein
MVVLVVSEERRDHERLNMISVTSQGTGDHAEYKVEVNGFHVGDMEQEESGLYVFWFSDRPHAGYWPEWLFLAIGEYLKFLNEDWEKEIERVLDGK